MRIIVWYSDSAHLLAEPLPNAASSPLQLAWPPHYIHRSSSEWHWWDHHSLSPWRCAGVPASLAGWRGWCILWLRGKKKNQNVIYVLTVKWHYELYISCMDVKYWPFSWLLIRTCRAIAASTLTGISLSLIRQRRVSSRAVCRFWSLLNFTSQK